MANSCNFDVDLIGWRGSEPMNDVKNNPNIHLHLIQPRDSLFNRFFFTRIFYKVFISIWQIFYILMFQIKRPSYILVQTPPAIPILFVAIIVCFLRRCKLIIDWHNFGYTWLAMNRPGASFLVPLHKMYEKVFGRMGHDHFCVSKAMKDELEKNWKIKANVLYDQAPIFFKETSIEEKDQLFSTYEWGNLNGYNDGGNDFIKDGKLRENRPALLVSSTSWTADEDFGILLESIKIFNEKIKGKEDQYPELRIIITGKGDLREHYEKIIESEDFKRCKFITCFLPHSDYVKLLGSADIGISLHVSSSKLDLPMKVVDMLGANLPAVAYNYGCLDELVLENVNGLTFNDSDSLSECLMKLLKDFPKNKTLQTLKSNLRSKKKLTWEENWDKHAKFVFNMDKKDK